MGYMKKYLDDQRGDAVIITAVILMSLAAAVGGRLLLDYGETIGKEDDMIHVSDVEDSFIRLRGSMYSLLESEDTRSTIISRVTLGTTGNPYLTVARSSGKLSYEASRDNYHISFYKSFGGVDTLIDSASGSLTYQSNNYYYDDQSLQFSGGGIVVDEYGYKAMTAPPSTNLIRGVDEYGIEMNVYGMSGYSWSVTGIDAIPLSVIMEGFSQTSLELEAGESIIIRVSGEVRYAWSSYFSSYLGGLGLVEGAANDFVIGSYADHEDIELVDLAFFECNVGVMEVSL